MQRVRTRVGVAGLLGLGLMAMLGAAPATPSYHPVLIGIDQARERLSGDRQSSENVENWNTFFNAVVEVLQAQAAAETFADRRAQLERLGRMRDALAAKNWGPSDRVAEALNDWLEPRLAVVRALEALELAVAQLPGEVLRDDTPDNDEGAPAPADPASAYKTAWATYVDRLQAAIRDYETARTVTDRLNAARKLRGGLASLRDTQARSPWAPAGPLSAALQGMLDRPNLQVTADPDVLFPFLGQQIVKPEIIFFRGQTSYVQPGPWTGFGLLHSNDGIAFYNGQWSHSTTPVSDFQQQVQQDPQGRMAANMYYFGATIYNTNHVTATAILTPDGVVAYPQNAPIVSAAFGLTPQAGLGPGLMRFVAGLVGFNQGRILSEIQRQAMPQIQAEAVSGTNELSAIKTAEQTAQENQRLRQYLVGNRTLRVQDFAITQLGLSSAPWAAYVSGVLQWASEAGPQIGADFPKPPEFLQPQSGLTVDVHLNSTLTNLIAGLYRTDEVAGTENLLVKLVPAEPGAPPEQGIELIRNASYDDLLAAIADVRQRSNNSPEAIALRVSKPQDPPFFAVDAEGRLTAFVRGVTIEVPAPENFGNQRGLFGLGGSPRVLRFILDEVEVAIAASITPEDDGRALRVTGEIASVSYGGPGTTVVTVGDAEDQTQTLNLLNRSAALGVLAGRLQGQDVDTTVPTDMLPGFLVAEVSAPHPSGWMRVVLRRDPTQPPPTLDDLAASPAPETPPTVMPQPAMLPAGYVSP